MTRRLLAFTCFISCLYSCGNESKTEVIDSKEIIPQSEKYRDETNIKTPTADSMDNSFNLQLAKELGLSIKAFQQVEEPFFLDRFTPKSLKKWQIDLETEKAFVGQWCYKDSVATMNAFYNWLDCFGSRCKSFKLMDKVNFQTDNFLVFLNDTSITYITSSFKLDKEMWRLYFEKQNSFEELDLIMYQTRRGKVNWLSYRETQKKDNFDYQPYTTNK
jgi:hypothetical protein